MPKNSGGGSAFGGGGPDPVPPDSSCRGTHDRNSASPGYLGHPRGITVGPAPVPHQENRADALHIPLDAPPALGVGLGHFGDTP